MSPRIAALDAGTFYHHETLRGPRFAGFLDATIYLPELARTPLDGIDILIVTCRTNPLLARRAADRLQGFLARGGTLVLMGECRPDLWLDGVDWHDKPTNFWWWLEPGASLGLGIAAPEHGLFRHIGLADASWHYHGWYAVPPGATSLIDCAPGQSILYDDPASWPGRLIATSLDPFYHHGSRFMPAATRFLAGFLPWLRAGAPA